jgi:hypothetical protein
MVGALIAAWLIGTAAGFGAADPARSPLQPPREIVPFPDPIPVDAPKQVSISVKVVEFQATKGVETGLSAFYARRRDPKPFGRVSDGEGAITTADLTFPLDMEGAITVFLDRLRLSDGDMEMVLQALVNENQAYILSRPRALVKVRGPVETILETVEENPYEKPTVVGTTVVQTTDFRKTGVIFTAQVPHIIDDDGNWSTTEDTYINLILRADIKELGEEIIVAEDDRFGSASRVTAPTFVSRSIDTQVWVRSGQVLVLGGLYRNRTIRSTEGVPGLSKLEDMTVGLLNRVIPGRGIGTPVSSSLGHRTAEDQRRELVFFIKAESWHQAYTVPDEDLASEEERRSRIRPTEIIGDVLGGISEIPSGIAEGISGEKEEGIESDLRGDKVPKGGVTPKSDTK